MDYCTKCRHQQLDYSRINTLWLQMADKNRKDKYLKKVKGIEKKMYLRCNLLASRLV